MKTLRALLVIATLVATTSAQTPHLIPFNYEGKWGFTAPDKELVIAHKYDEAKPFNEGLAAVRVGDLWATSTKPTAWSSSRASTRSRISMKASPSCVATTRTPISRIKASCSPPFEFDFAQRFIEGRGRVEKKTLSSDSWTTRARWSFPAMYEDAGDFHEGLAGVRHNGLCGFIDRDGKPIVPFEYEDFGHFSSGLAPVKQNERWGYISDEGFLSIEFQFEEALPFSQGVAGVMKDGMWGFVNRAGEMVIDYQFLEVGSFNGGLAPAMSVETFEWGYINGYGEFVVEPEYEFAYPFQDERGLVKDGKEFGFLKPTGEMIFDNDFKHAEGFYRGLAYVNYDGLWGYLGKDGTLYIEE